MTHEEALRRIAGMYNETIIKDGCTTYWHGKPKVGDTHVTHYSGTIREAALTARAALGMPALPEVRQKSARGHTDEL